MKRRTPTTKDIGLLKQLHDQGQLILKPEFQRNAVWPRQAKAYLMDTILKDRPIPLFFFEKISSAQTGRSGFAVIDGQQRLRAIFEFMADGFRLSESKKSDSYFNKKFSELSASQRDIIETYDLAVQELSGYAEDDIKDIFVRMNKYVVKLAPQELRHASHTGAFADFVERVGKWPFWTSHKVISAKQDRRMRAVEFVAELVILLIEGPQDKKSAVDLYYEKYKKKFSRGKQIEALLRRYTHWIHTAVPNISRSRYRSPTDFYALVGALHILTDAGGKLGRLDAAVGGAKLRKFEDELKLKDRGKAAERYLAAASRQTDNVQPRMARIETIQHLLK